MKNLFKLLVLFITVGLMITSCKTASITKRHYNKGYYVSHSGKKGKAVSHESTDKQTVVTAEALAPKITVLPKTTDDKQLVASNIQAKKTESNKVESENKTIQNKIRYAGTDNSVSLKEMVKNPFKLTKIVSAADSEDDALSLLWILIVVLLIVYIAGLLLDNFGLGGIIHILGVIVLVLLILWLLRII